MDINTVIMTGNVVADATKISDKCAKFRIATGSVWCDKNENNHDDRCFIDVLAAGYAKDNVLKLCKKGTPVTVEASLRANKKNNNEYYLFLKDIRVYGKTSTKTQNQIDVENSVNEEDYISSVVDSADSII